MEIGSLRAAAESTKHFADHKRPARKNPRARWPVFGRTGFKMTQGSSHSLSHWNRKGENSTQKTNLKTNKLTFRLIFHLQEGLTY